MNSKTIGKTESEVVLELELLEILSNAFGPSGDEELVANIITSELQKNNYPYIVDKKGNILCIKDTENTNFKVLIASHIDEVGFLVSEKIEPHYLKVEPLGGWNLQTIPSTKVIIKTRAGFIRGVFSSTPPHLSQTPEIKSISDLYIDVGDNYNLVDIGNFVVPLSQFEVISPSLIMGKAFDNRIGTYINLHLLKYVEPSVDVYHAFLVQEELGLRGSSFFAKNTNFLFDLIIVLEATSGETPYTKEQVSRINEGPVLTIMDKTYITNPKLVELIKEIAFINEIPLQIKKPNIGSTDAGQLQNLGNTIIISVPTKYIHTPYQICSLSDIQNTIKLLSILISTPNIEEIYKKIL
ncbi:MAG: hypothetical protein RMJ51_02375 [Candidatus Calescibacterium sp.]|nr:hypothetical protein [Candidatus Calescibacterium sp.]MCX7972324.1 hypothetical protein [bacterium]MDW8195072.1 hypothetical protein [Candidatus Calescibacterium sp.]